jgi:hypothetical protein
MNTRKHWDATQYANRVFPVLCPRCGLDICYFEKGQIGPYCASCGWNLDFVSRARLNNTSGFWAVRSLPALFALLALLQSASWRSVLLTFAISSLLAVIGEFVGRKNLKRMANIVAAVSEKPGADLSSNAPDAPPDKVLAREVSLRLGPRHVRFKSSARVVMWIASILPTTILYSSVRPIFITEYRLDRFPGPWLYLFETLIGVALWFLIFETFRVEHPVELVTKGDISMAKVIPDHDPGRRMEVIFEFRDVCGSPVRALRHSYAGHFHSGTYLPVFYRREDPEKCLAACDPDCELTFSSGTPPA